MNIRLFVTGALVVLICCSARAKGGGPDAVYFDAARQGDVATLQQYFATNVNAASLLNDLFREAVLSGQKDATEFLLQRGADVNQKAFIDLTPLGYLATYGTRDDAKCADVAKVLIAHGAQVEPVDGNRATPILQTVEAKKSQLARVLLEHGANVVARYNDTRSGMTLLHMAVAHKDKDMVAVLLEFKAPIDAVDGQGATPLAMAEGREETEIVALLRAANPEAGKDAPDYSPLPTREEMRALAQRICNGDASFDDLSAIMTKLYGEIKDYRKEGGRMMAVNGHISEVINVFGAEAGKGNDKAVDALKKCLQSKTMLTSLAPDALGAAAASGNKDALDVLLHYKDWDMLESSARFAICKPIEANFAPAVEESAKWLLSLKGMERNSGMADSTTNSLAIAAAKGNQTARETLEKFFASAPSPEATQTPVVRMPQRDPNVPAHWAFLVGDEPLLNRVLASTNLIDALDENHETALAWAVKAHKFEIARALLEHGAKIPQPVLPPPGYYGMGMEFKQVNMERVPLLWAVTHGDKDAVTLLLEFKAPLDAADQDGKTPLHYAVAATNIQMVQLLLAAKAPVDSVAKDGATPLMIAETDDNEDLVKMLREAGAAPVSSVTLPTRREMHDIAERICGGDAGSFDELAKAADDLFSGVDVRKNDARMKLSQARLGTAFGVLADAAAHNNDNAFQALKKCLSQPNVFLKGAAPYSLGKAAAAGHSEAMDILVNCQKWGINQVSAYFALTPAAKANMEPAVDAFIALASDPAAAKKKYYGISYLVKEVLQSASAQGNQKAAEALEKFTAASEQAKN